MLFLLFFAPSFFLLDSILTTIFQQLFFPFPFQASISAGNSVEPRRFISQTIPVVDPVVFLPLHLLFINHPTFHLSTLCRNFCFYPLFIRPSLRNSAINSAAFHPYEILTTFPANLISPFHPFSFNYSTLCNSSFPPSLFPPRPFEIDVFRPRLNFKFISHGSELRVITSEQQISQQISIHKPFVYHYTRKNIHGIENQKRQWHSNEPRTNADPSSCARGFHPRSSVFKGRNERDHSPEDSVSSRASQCAEAAADPEARTPVAVP